MEKQKNAHRLVQLALLVAVELVMTYTPLGYLHVGPLSITFLMIPVVLGAILIGPTAGAVLGGVFGLTSFAQCFGAEAFGVVLLGISPLRTFLVCVPTRILVACFYSTEYIQGLAQSMGAANPFTFVALFVGVQGIVEAVVGFLACTAISKGVWGPLHRNH